MDTQHWVLDLFIVSTDVDTAAVVDSFHRWIQSGEVDDVAIDVARYKHVLRGPGILLIGHGADLSVDFTDGRPRLRVRTKRERVPLQVALRLLLDAASRLERDVQVAFETSRLDVAINDRLHAPNTAETFEARAPELESALTALFGGSPSLEHRADPRERFTVQARVESGPSLDELRARLPAKSRPRRSLQLAS